MFHKPKMVRKDFQETKTTLYNPLITSPMQTMYFYSMYIFTTTKQTAMVWACVAKKDNDWVKKSMEYVVACSRPRGRSKRTWKETVKHVD